ncbi:hypothetical protein GP5015_42 [gamma proteobacterium HTCC5015]|nr:hypothetical protein GP5015_42 [gamma proteobacterium HTCC5015]
MSHPDANTFKPLLKAIDNAKNELSDSMSTGNFSDSKSALYALLKHTKKLSLTDPSLHHELKALSQSCWNAMYRFHEGGDSVYAKAGRCIHEVGKLETRVKEVCSSQ